MLVEDGDICLGGFFCQSCSHPLKDGHFLVDTLVLRELLYLLRAVLVESDGGIFGESQLVLQTMVLSLSDVDLGNTDLAFQLSAYQLPFLVEIDAGGVVGLIEVDEEGLAGLEEGGVPVVIVKQEGVRLLPEFLLIAPFLVGTLLFSLLVLLEGLKGLGILGS